MRAALLALLLTACGAGEAPSRETPDKGAAPDRPALGLMTSLPLYWPLGAELADLAGGTVAPPWQRAALEQDHRLVLLDTLSPIPALTDGGTETDPLSGLTRLAIIQPRGLAPADNVALDAWVQAGGHLLLVLDPLLTGDYDLPLGDARRPSDVALIPPVVARWGLAITFDETQDPTPRMVSLGEGLIPLALAGDIALDPATARRCTRVAGGAAARCDVGKGRVTVLADAAVFEQAAAEGAASSGIAALLAFAFD